MTRCANIIRLRLTFSKCHQIIIRARQNHLLETFRTETTLLSTDLIARIHTAWRTHVREKIGKGLSETDKPAEGQEDQAFSRLTQLAQDKQWKQECLKRDEKFDMHLTSAVWRTYTSLGLLIEVSSGPCFFGHSNGAVSLGEWKG
jgi:hypothetical protein